MKKQVLVLLGGPSGAGKTTLMNELITRRPGFARPVSSTTRSRRGEEAHGREYYFCTVEDFKGKISRGEMLEYDTYDGNFYGLEVREVDRVLKTGMTPVACLTYFGIQSIMEAYPGSLDVCILPESLDVLRQRLIARGDVSSEEMERRLAIAKDEMDMAWQYQRQIINHQGKQAEAVDDLFDIICARYCLG